MSAFQHAVYGCHHFPAKKQSSFDFMAAVTIFSDFGAQVMLEPKKRKSVTTSPSTCHAVTYVCVCVCVCMYVCIENLEMFSIKTVKANSLFGEGVL